MAIVIHTNIYDNYTTDALFESGRQFALCARRSPYFLLLLLLVHAQWFILDQSFRVPAYYIQRHARAHKSNAACDDGRWMRVRSKVFLLLFNFGVARGLIAANIMIEYMHRESVCAVCVCAMCIRDVVGSYIKHSLRAEWQRDQQTYSKAKCLWSSHCNAHTHTHNIELVTAKNTMEQDICVHISKGEFAQKKTLLVGQNITRNSRTFSVVCVAYFLLLTT